MEREACGCPDCDVVWHLACGETPELCPACAQDHKVTAHAIADRRQHEVRQQIDRGRTIYKRILFLRILVTVVSCTVLLKFDLRFNLLLELSSLLVFVAIWLTAYQGRAGARHALAGIALCWLAIVSLIAGQFLKPEGFTRIPPHRQPEAHQPEPLRFLPLASVGLSALYFAWACLFSKDLKYYEAGHRASSLQN